MRQKIGWGLGSALLGLSGLLALGAARPPGSAIALGTRDRPSFVGNVNTVVSGTLTRPADTTQYAQFDEISNSASAPTVLAISGAARINGGSGVITRIDVIDSINAATDPDLQLVLMDTTSTPSNDNAAIAMSDAEAATVLFAGDMGAGVTLGANNLLFTQEVEIPFKCGTSTDDLFVRLWENATYTPSSAETFTVRLHVRQD